MSPDLNPIENLLRDLKIIVSRRAPTNLHQLERVALEELTEIPVEACSDLSRNYWKRVLKVLNI